MDQRTGTSPGRDEAGFTLIELLVGMVIVTMLSALSVSGYASYQRAIAHKGAATEIVSTMRNAQQRSLAEAATYCVAFNAASGTYQLYKFACGATGTAVGNPKRTGSSRVSLSSPSFLQPGGGTATTAIFYPRGSATAGTVKVLRNGGSASYTITVEGLTGRVSLNG